MKSKDQLQYFILSIRNELKEFISLTKVNPNSNIIKIFNELFRKYSELNTNKIKLVSSSNNFAYLQTNQKIKTSKKTKKTKNKKKNKKSKQKKYDKFEGYFDNLDACHKFYRRDTYKSNYLRILDLLYNKYYDLLQIIYREHRYDPEEVNKIESFLKNMDQKTLEEKIEWSNFDGVKLARSIYILFLNNQLSQEVMNLFGDTPELYGQFTSLDVQRDIELNIPFKYHYQYKLLVKNPIDLTLTIHSHKNNYRITKKFLYRIFFINYLTNKSQIDLKIWLSSVKKMLPNKNKLNNTRYLGAKEINSGCTTFTGTLPNKVSLWRQEEVRKVLIHELIHSVELEEHNNLYDFEEFIFSHFDIRRELNNLTFFENYVELWGNIINISIVVYDKKNNNDNLTNFLDLLERELYWVLFQVAKILVFFDYNKFEDFYFKDGIKEESKSKKYIQKSNIFSYIVVRSMMFFNLEKFVNVCYKYNTEFVIKYRIPNSEIIKLMVDTLNDKKYIRAINFLMNFIRKNKDQSKFPSAFKSMRMSHIE